MKTKCYEKKELTQKYLDLARFLRIIGDNNRLKILCLLKDDDLYVEELSLNLDLAQNLVSSHLKVMIDFGLLVVKQEGKKNYYSINNKIFKKYNSLVNKFLENYKR
ncbi:MAG TPA: metalloregulator ArsR/SmtB family transcription factor [Patescibacteria group bacterium]|nr:metalloregulator ArsR/SmtB family transcription factor [Patescibacteria group bacterium]